MGEPTFAGMRGKEEMRRERSLNGADDSASIRVGFRMPAGRER
jgi:hypothetical protein